MIEAADEARDWRRSGPSKVVALGFCLLIVAGNVWLALALVKAPVPIWVGVSFVAALAVVAVGGTSLAVVQLTRRWTDYTRNFSSSRP